MTNRTFFYPDYGRYVLFESHALEHMYEHTQRRFWQKEAGGEIYTANVDPHSLIISKATGPNPGDRRGRHHFNPDTKATTKNREQQYALGRHTVGLWHTHPEKNPVPSIRDRQTTEKYLNAFNGSRERYLIVILGNRGNPVNMVIWSVEQRGYGPWIRLIES